MVMPVFTNYTVKKGDTLYTIARNNNVSVDLGYRYLNMTDSDVTLGAQEIKIKPYSHQVLAGVRVSF